MSDRKYRQRGYQDEPRAAAARPKSEPVPRELRKPNVPGFRDVARCARCGNRVTGEIAIESRCAQCGADLHSGAQCTWFDTSAVFECVKPVPARVSPKDARNACTLFEARVTVERETGSTRPPDARSAFDDLFK